MSEQEEIRKPLEGLLEDIAEDLYWSRDLEEAERKRTAYLEEAEEGHLKAKYEQWVREYCKAREGVKKLILFDSEKGLSEDPLSHKVYTIRDYVEKGIMLPCTYVWRNTERWERAFILTPLLIAAYATYLALRDWPNSLDEENLNYALQMIQIGFSRAKKLGVLDDVYSYIEDSILVLMGEKEPGLIW